MLKFCFVIYNVSILIKEQKSAEVTSKFCAEHKRGSSPTKSVVL